MSSFCGIVPGTIVRPKHLDRNQLRLAKVHGACFGWVGRSDDDDDDDDDSLDAVISLSFHVAFSEYS